MHRIPEPSPGEPTPKSAPAVALDWCQRLQELIEAHHQAGAVRYSAQRDAEYRRLRHQFLDLLQQTPSLQRLTEGANVFPSSLADICDETEKVIWDVIRRQDVVRIQGRILTVLESEGVEAYPTSSDRGTSTNRSHNALSARASPVPDRPNRAQRRAEQRRGQARQLRDEGKTIKEIAYALSCSERTVFSYLQDMN